MSDAELQEFLEADQSPVPVRPRFREALRQRLWRILKIQASERRRGGHPEPEPSEPKPRDVARRRGDD